MNTPKLISIFSSPAHSLDAARAGRVADPTHGLDFSQLLGERRSQGASAFDSTTVRRDANRSTTQMGAASQQRNASATQDNTPSSRNTASSSSRNESSQAERKVASANHDTSSPSSQPGTQPSRADSKPAADQSSSAPAATSNTATGQADTELAQNAAESGQVLITAPVASPLLPVNAEAEAASGQRPALLVTNVLSTTAPEAVTAQPGTAAASPLLSVDATADDTPEALIRTVATQQAGVNLNHPAAAPTPAAPIPGTAPAFAATPETPIAPTALAPHAALADAPAATPAQAPMGALQDFTAMVQAAKATTGAIAPAASQGLPASVSAAAATALPVSAMPVGGLLPGHNPLQPLSNVPGISAPLGSPQWPTEFGRQFISIAQASNGLGQVAELRLDPPELGPLRITINLNDSVAHAVISSPHAAVRQSVENALPQLQQMLEQAGISLGQASVNDQHQPGHGAQGGSRNGNPSAGTPDQSGGTTLADGSDELHPQRPADPNALVDTFA